ncbi:MAG: cell division ATP-binding protein FtsE, partial [Syntrophomonadaceae bacterium]|nr:cell division ATP-binding protein FtsE [Syntrophomonadaceae bacterium]
MMNVSKIYPTGTRALIDLSLKIDKGEFIFLVGASGAGKSSFIKLLLREELPSRGQILIGGRNLARMRRRRVPMLRRNLGIVFQDFRLLPNYTVFDNVAFALRVVETSPREISGRVEETLRLVGLQGKGQLYPERLSGGEQQRVGIARAIVNRPMILLADEPTGNLDMDTSWEIMKILTEINRRGTTVVMATHAKEIVDKMRRRVIEIENGRLVRDEKQG